MTLKEYLYINDDVFTLSNQFLFIYHHNGEEFVLNLKTKKIYNNPTIPDRTNSLTRLLEIPIDENHTQKLYHKDKLVYHENLEVKTYTRFVFLKANKTTGEKVRNLIYGIQKENEGTFKHKRVETVNSNFKPFGESTECYQFRPTLVRQFYQYTHNWIDNLITGEMGELIPNTLHRKTNHLNINPDEIESNINQQLIEIQHKYNTIAQITIHEY